MNFFFFRLIKGSNSNVSNYTKQIQILYIDDGFNSLNFFFCSYVPSTIDSDSECEICKKYSNETSLQHSLPGMHAAEISEELPRGIHQFDSNKAKILNTKGPVSKQKVVAKPNKLHLVANYGADSDDDDDMDEGKDVRPQSVFAVIMEANNDVASSESPETGNLKRRLSEVNI
jgi:hypothetical protein